jgi:hypothetical protein
MKTCVHLWYLHEFFLVWEMFQTKLERENTFHVFYIYIYVCVCVCVCARARVRVRAFAKIMQFMW